MTRTAAMSMAFSAPDALLIVLTSFDRYSPRSGTRFAAWVTTIAVNTAHRRFRRRRPGLTPTGEVPELPAGMKRRTSRYEAADLTA